MRNHKNIFANYAFSWSANIGECIYIYIYIYIYIPSHAHSHSHTNTHTHTHIYIYIYIYKCIYMSSFYVGFFLERRLITWEVVSAHNLKCTQLKTGSWGEQMWQFKNLWTAGIFWVLILDTWWLTVNEFSCGDFVFQVSFQSREEQIGNEGSSCLDCLIMAIWFLTLFMAFNWIRHQFINCQVLMLLIFLRSHYLKHFW